MKGGDFPVLDLQRQSRDEGFRIWAVLFLLCVIVFWLEKGRGEPGEAILGYLEVGCAWKGNLKGLNCIHRALSSSSKWKHDVYASAKAGGAGRGTQCCKAAEAFHWWQHFSQCVPVGVWVDGQQRMGRGGWTKKLNCHHTSLHNGTLASGQREHLNSGEESRPSCLGLSLVNAGTQGWGTRHYPLVGRLFGRAWERRNSLQKGLGAGRKPLWELVKTLQGWKLVPQDPDERL